MKNQPLVYAHSRGNIQDNALKALVTDKLFASRIERNKKGKGSYQRHAKHRHKLTVSPNENPFKSLF